MTMKNTILSFIEVYQEDILEKGKSVVISLSDGYCIIEKGIDDSPFTIKIDDLELGLPIKINEYVNVTIKEFLGIEI